MEQKEETKKIDRKLSTLNEILASLDKLKSDDDRLRILQSVMAFYGYEIYGDEK